MKNFFIALTATCFLACSLPAFNAEIAYFYDGDTVKIKEDLYEYKLRLTDIDAPERNQDYGKKSRRALMQFCQNAIINVYISGTDKYHRQLGKLKCNQNDASEFMITNGHAWFNKRYSMDYKLDLAEQNAKKQKLGLWERENAMPPWQWRKSHPREMLK